MYNSAFKLPDTSELEAVDVTGLIVGEGSHAIAFSFLQALAKEVSSGKVDLPCLPDVLIRIRRALMDPRSTTQKLAKIVEVEPLLVKRILHTANSAHFNVGGKPVKELSLAMTRLGQQLVQSLAMAFSMRQVKTVESLRPVARELNDLWNRNIAAAVLARLLAPRAQVHPDTAFLTGLLSGIGRLYVLTRAVAFSDSLLHSQDFLDVVSQWHASIGKEVLQNWGFVEEADAVGAQEDFDRQVDSAADLTDVLIAATALTNALCDKSGEEQEIPGAEAFSRLNLSADDTVALLTAAKSLIATTHADLNF